MSFVKLHNSILTSTIWCGKDAETKVVWITMLAMADRNGMVEATVPGIAKLAEVPVEKTQQVLNMLSQELDPLSRTESNGGLRVKHVNGGYMLLNYSMYRNMAGTRDRKDYMRKYMRDYMRKKRSAGKLDQKLDPVIPILATKPQAEADNTITPIIPSFKLNSVKKFVEEEQKKQEFRTKLSPPRICMMPQCGKPVDPKFKPFCSQACADYANFLNSKHGPSA